MKKGRMDKDGKIWYSANQSSDAGPSASIFGLSVICIIIIILIFIFGR
jgi:hypothetical protein